MTTLQKKKYPRLFLSWWNVHYFTPSRVVLASSRLLAKRAFISISNHRHGRLVNLTLAPSGATASRSDRTILNCAWREATRHNGCQEQAPEKPIMWPSENLSCREKKKAIWKGLHKSSYATVSPLNKEANKTCTLGRNRYSWPKKWLYSKASWILKYSRRHAVRLSVDYLEDDRNVWNKLEIKCGKWFSHER